MLHDYPLPYETLKSETILTRFRNNMLRRIRVNHRTPTSVDSRVISKRSKPDIYLGSSTTLVIKQRKRIEVKEG